MKVLVTGATGFIGAQIAARLTADGHHVVGLARSAARARRRHPAIEWTEGDFRHLTDPADWQAVLDGAEAVINCAGVLQNGAADSLTDVHVKGADGLFAACSQRGISRFVQISAAGAASDAVTDFMRTKAEGDARLHERIPDAVILRPALVVGQAAYGGTALIRALAASPLVVPLPRIEAAIQTVDMDDITETVSRILSGDGIPGSIYTLAHPERSDLGTIVSAYRRWLGLREARILRVPGIAVAVACRMGDLLGHLGWRPPVRTTAIRQLTAGITGDPSGWISDFAIPPRRLADRLARTPSTVQDLWHARLFLLKPLLILALGLVWIGSGVVALGPGSATAASILESAGIPRDAAPVVNTMLSLADIAVGCAIFWARSLKITALLMAAMCVVYLAGTAAFAPGLWLDPVGPALKIVGLLGLALVVAAIAEER